MDVVIETNVGESIRINGVCYYLDSPTSDPITHELSSIEGIYTSCGVCTPSSSSSYSSMSSSYSSMSSSYSSMSSSYSSMSSSSSRSSAPRGGCCVQGSCVWDTESRCTGYLDGIYMGDGVDCPIPTCAKLATCTDRGATCTRSVNTEHTSHAGLFVGYGATADLARIHAWSTCWNYLDDYGFLVCGGSNYLDHIACACTINEPSQTGAGGDLAWECFPNVCCIQ